MKISRQSILAVSNWGIVTVFVLFQFFMQAIAGIMARQWRIDFDLSQVQVGNLSAAFFYVYVLLQIPVGFIYDKFNSKWILGCASLLLAYACYKMSVSTCYAEALYARVLMGTASSFGFVGMLYLTAQWFEGKYFALMVGLAESVAMLGVALTEVGMSYLVQSWGWRATMSISASVAFVLTFFVLFFIQDKEKHEADVKTVPVWETLYYVIKQPTVLVYGFYGFTLLSLITVFASLWGIPFLRVQYHGMHLPVAASLVSMVYIGVALGCPTLSWIATRLENRKAMMVGCALMTTCLLSMVLYIKSLPLTYLYVLLFFAAFFSSSYIQSFDYAKRAVPKAMEGVCLAFTNMLMMMSAPVLQLLVGSTLHHGWTFVESLSILPVLMMMAVLFLMAERQKIR